MNNKAHLRPKDFDSNGDIIPMACKEVKGDLISREALKKAFENLASDDYNEPIWYQKTVFETIDNAPTVEYPFYQEAYQTGYEEGKNERPQGEWNYIQAGMCVCPFCGAMPHKLYKNFCAKCGADMRKGGAK